jgi:hypothetical protein
MSMATPLEKTNVDTSSYMALWDLDGKELDAWVTSVPTIFPKGKAFAIQFNSIQFGLSCGDPLG